MGGNIPLFQELVAKYAALDIKHPGLKAVTLAQWALESGWGTSELAVKHFNFGGLKWRKEMEPYATEVSYEAHDGLAGYCAFADIDAFLKGYWAFIGRKVYDGWEAHAGDPETFIRFIGEKYCPQPDYADRVLALLPQTTDHLALAQSPPSGKSALAAVTSDCCYVGAGHSNVDPGAVAHGVQEADVVTALRNRVAEILLKSGHCVLTDGLGLTNLPLDKSIALAKTCGPKRIELHLNSSESGTGKGVECLSLEAQKPLAEKLAQAIAGALGIGLHGNEAWKPDTASAHGSLGFCRRGEGIVVECFFLTNKSELDAYNANKEQVAQAIAKALL